MGIKTVSGRRVARTVGAIAPLEAEVQKALFEFMATARIETGAPIGDYAYAVPNGTMFAGTAQQRAKYSNALKSQGLRPGVSDVVIALPRGQYHGAYIELKREAKSKVGDDQRIWLTRVEAVGYYSALACGLDSAISHVREYIKMGPFKS